MKFKSNSRRRALEYEKDILNFWKQNNIFEKSVEQRPESQAYVFYDGPPFITGVPHHGTLLSSIVKDAVPRYQTMKGRRVERRWGWDCHGLPAENFTEKKLGITNRHDIGTKIPLETYITTCRDNMVNTGGLWENTIDRIGRWVNFKGAYKTMDREFMESVWWAFKTLYEKGKIYEGEKVLMYDTKWATPLSKAEVTMDAGAYQVVTDPSVYVKFKVANEENKYLLAWTTTPWTLPSNVVLAVNPELDYVSVKYENDVLIMAKSLVEKTMTDEKHQPLKYEIIDEFKGEKLVGVKYEPLFDNHGEKAHQVYAADYVSSEDGTGIVHTAPAYGEEDFGLAKQYGLPVVHKLDEYGVFTDGEWQGKYLWDVNKEIAKKVLADGKALKIEYIRHEYPHNPRTNERLIYRAHPSWFMDIDGQRSEMLENNSPINWFPEHIKNGRFQKTIETAPDWNLSRDRFWATAMPIWEGETENGEKKRIVMGSYEELKKYSGVELPDYHRPWVDEIEFDYEGVHYKRVDKVLDCWFESGSMPFAQFHYPFENVEKFENSFPGDFIVEYVGQVRAWFYYVHAVSTALFGKNAFKNVIVTGTVAGNDGRKMSKSYGNYTDPNELMDKFSADSLRFLLLQSPLLNGEDFALIDKDVADVARKLTMIWNMYDFFTMYAEVDNWEFDGKIVDPLKDSLDNYLDSWVVSRLHEVVNQVETAMDSYNIPEAMKPILPFIDDASNWYVRRSRRRFWKSGDDSDKNQAYKTLHYVLTRLSILLAPFTPFLAEELYKKMTGGESVHLLDWMSAGEIDEKLLNEMNLIRDLINQALGDRARNQVKVRQPLATFTVKGRDVENLSKYADIFEEELNVKQTIFENSDTEPKGELDFAITKALELEGLTREIIRGVQSARKQAGLNIDDRIKLELVTADCDLIESVKQFEDLIKNEVLADELLLNNVKDAQEDEFSTTGKANGIEFEIRLSKNA